MSRIINNISRKYADYEDIKAFRNSTYLYIIGVSVLLPHIFFLFYFLAKHIPFMAAVNIASCAVYIIVIAFISAKKQKLACVILTLEVTIYSLVTTACFGPNIDAQSFIIPLILAQYLIFDFKQSERLYVAVVLSLIWYGAMFLNLIYTPPFSGSADWLLRRINLLIVVLFILEELIMNMLIEQIERAFYSKKITEVTEESYVDPLTQLKNRRYADNVFFKQVADWRNRNVSFVMMDLDHFKGINDRYGHEGGDLVLKSFGEILTRGLRSTDLICRWGGEEFLIVMLDCDLNYAYIVISKIKEVVSSNEVYYNGAPISFTFTAGLCQYNNERIADIINKCDAKLYEGKNSGRNKIVF